MRHMAFDPQKDVANSAALISVFGSWPSFHDAEIVSILLRRGPQDPSLECAIHVFGTANEVDERGHFVTRNHVIVEFLFSNIELERLEDFNRQNVIDELRIERTESGRFSILMPPNNGCEVRLACESIRILMVREYAREERVRDGSVYSR